MSRELSYPARWDFDVNGRYSYQEYRKAIEFEKVTAFAFDRQTRELVASNNELAKIGLSVGHAIESKLSGIHETLNGGFNQISGQLDGIDGTLQEIHTTLGMGLSIIGLNTGRMADTLQQLLHAVTNPSLTWALEQYDIARDEVRRGLISEAYDSLQKAINGYGSNPGYKTEFRFHMLLGSLCLGEFDGHPIEMIDPAKAREAFVYSAKLAVKDFPDEAHRALVLAARAAYLEQDPSKAMKLMGEARRPNSNAYYKIKEFDYLSAKYAIASSSAGGKNVNLEKAETWLEGCFIHSNKFALIAASDRDLITQKEMLARLIGRARIEVRKRIDDKIERTKTKIERFEKFENKFKFFQPNNATILQIRNNIVSFKIDEFEQDNDTLLGLHLRLATASDSYEKLQDAKQGMTSAVGELSKRSYTSGAYNNMPAYFVSKAGVTQIRIYNFYVAMWIIAFCVFIFMQYQAWNEYGISGFLSMAIPSVIVAAILLGSLCGVVWLAGKFFLSISNSSDASVESDAAGKIAELKSRAEQF